MIFDWASIGPLKSRFALKVVVAHLVHVPRSRGTVIYHRIRDGLRINRLETYAGDILDEGALPDRLRANNDDLRQAKFKGSPIAYRVVSAVENG
jgi:hypothetical protein